MVAAGWGSLALLLWAGAVGVLALSTTWWAANAWTGVAVDARIEPVRTFVGEPAFLSIHISNRGRRRVPIVRVVARLPPDLHPDPDTEPLAFLGHRRRVTLPPSSTIELRLPLHAAHRGEYFVEPVEVSLSDPFDLLAVRRAFEPNRPLLVLPGPGAGRPLRVRRWLPFGAPAPGARLFEDREHIAGVRDYEPGDPMHHVHWRVSAHAGRLQTKTFEPTRSAEVLFALDLSAAEPFWEGVDQDAAEATISWAGYLARQAMHAGWRTGLVANTHLRRGRGPLRVAPSGSATQASAVFTALARIPSQPTSDLSSVLREVGRRLTRPTTVVVLSHAPGPSLLHEMAALRRRGADVVHVTPGMDT